MAAVVVRAADLARRGVVAEERHRIGRVVGVRVGRRAAAGPGVALEPSVPTAGVRRAVAREEVVPPPGPRERPLVLVTPLVSAHHEQADARARGGGRIVAERLLEPLELEAAQVELRARPEVDPAERPLPQRREPVVPRADQEPLRRADLPVRAVARHAREVLGGAALDVVVPAADVQHRHLDRRHRALVAHRVPVGAVGDRALQVAPPVLAAISGRLVHRQQRQVPEDRRPVHFLDVLLHAAVEHAEPADLPRNVHPRRHVLPGVRRRDEHDHRAQVRRALERRQPLDVAQVGRTPGDDPAVRPGLRGEPLDRVVAVATLRPPRLERPVRVAAPAHVHPDKRVPVLGVHLGEKLLLRRVLQVGRAREDGRAAAVLARVVEVGRELDPVAHRDAPVPVDRDLERHVAALTWFETAIRVSEMLVVASSIR